MYVGPQCELDISICNNTDKICQNGGQCIDGIGESFHCMCSEGWEGEICQHQINYCISQPCQNGAICVNNKIIPNDFNKSNDLFSCACPFGKLKQF